MKTLLSLLLLLLCTVKISFAQLNSLNKQDDMMLFSVALNQPFYNNDAFDTWTANHYNLIKNTHPNVTVDLDFVGKLFNLGVIVETPSPLTLNRGYVGVKLFGHNKSISSWLNIEVGQMHANFKDISPLNYTLAPDQVGQKMELHYDAGYIGLAWRNYLNFLHFNAGTSKFVIPFNVGFYISAGITPFVQHWKYGYNKPSDDNDDDDGSDFQSTRIYDIPKLSNVYVNTGLFLSF